MASLASDGLVNDSYRVDLYEVAGGHYRDPDHHIRWFVIAKQRNLRFFDDWNTSLDPVATTTCVYISGTGRSSGLMSSSDIK
jgi:hypothetical protein